jgi:hypothetical protein
MKLSQFKQIIREEIQKYLPEELDHTYEGIEDSILGGIADWTGMKKSQIWNSLSPAAAKALSTLIKELKPILDKKNNKNALN